MKVKEIEGDKPLFIIEDLLSKEECKKLIEKAHQVKTDDKGNKSWHAPKDNTGQYMRVVMIDEELSTLLWERIKDVLEDNYKKYKLEFLNPYFRFSKYSKGGMFPIHCDGKNYQGDCEALYTLNIFLNDDFEGGATDFFQKEKGGRRAILRHRTIPKTGSAALFWGDQLHRGNTVESDYKYLLRTDVMGHL
jgi:prolyl 4-hydroxylase